MPALLIQPPRFVEVPTSGETVTTRSATSGASRTRSTKKRPNACCVDARPVCSRPRPAGTSGGGATNFGGGRSSRRPVAAHSSASALPSAKPRPRIARVGPELAGEVGVLLVVQQRGVVGRVALGRQRPALDRVREDDGRAGSARRRPAGRRRPARPRSWPPRSRKVASRSASSRSATSTSRRSRSSAASARSSRWYSSFGIASTRSRSAPSRRQPRAVLDHHAVPAGALEHRRQPAGGDVGHHAVERLPVEVDHPHDLAELGHHRVGDRLPAGALVQLRVADQRDLAAAARDLEVPGDVAMGERAPDRRGRAEADRAGRVVDGVGVLRAAGIGLQAAVLAQRGQVAAVEAAEQVVDRVQDRRGVRLDRHAVGRLQVREPERGHQAHHRRARGLVAADLHAGCVRAHAVRVVHDRRGEPQHAPLDAVERREVELGLRGYGHAVSLRGATLRGSGSEASGPSRAHGPGAGRRGGARSAGSCRRRR